MLRDDCGWSLLRGLMGVTLMALVLSGCGGGEQSADRGADEAGAAGAAGSGAGSSTANEGDTAKSTEGRLEPFDPPPLEELDAKAAWEDQPVVDAYALRQEKEAKETPLCTVQEALALRNDSLENNSKILSAVGRLAESEDKIDRNATLVRCIKGDIKSTNPLMQSSVEEFDVAGLTAFGLFGFDWKMQPFALSEFVTSWQVSQDRMYDKVVIRDDLTWSDGKPITAHDVAFSFQVIMNPDVPVPAARSGTDQLRWVHAYDDRTLVYFHKQASPTNVWNVNFPVIPKHVYENSIKDDPSLQNSEYHVALESKPVCGGPYILKSRVRGSELVFERRDDFYVHQGKQVRRPHHFKEVRLKIITDTNTALLALRKGDVDEMELNAEQWMTQQTNNDEYYSRNTKATDTEWVEFHFIWNCKRPWFSDVGTRYAMSYAFDHQEMLEKQFYGLYKPAAGPFHYTSWMAPKTPTKPFTQDLDKAEELLDEAGWVDTDGDGIREKMIDGKKVRFEFTLLCGQSPVAAKVAELLKESLDKIGVVCNVKPLEVTVLQQLELEHDFDAAMGGWGTGTDPDTTENIFGTGKERNFGQYSNPEVDKLYAAGRLEFDREKRAEIYAKIHELVYADQPYTWLYYRNSFYGFNKSLRGYMFSPRGPYHYNPGWEALWKAATP